MLYTTALFLTQVYFPFMFALVRAGLWPLLLLVLLVLLRNLLLLAALLGLVFPSRVPLRWLQRPVRPVRFA